MARSLSIAESSYRDWEYGRSITGEPYLKIANLLDVSLSELFGTKENDVAIQLKDLQITLEGLANNIRNIRSRL